MVDENIEWQIPEQSDVEDEEENQEELDEELEEDSEPESIENIVRRAPTSRPSIVHQLTSPVLESRPVPQTSALETELQETPAQETPQEEFNQEKQYDSSNYMSDTYQSAEADYPEIMQPANPILEQDFTRIQQAPRLSPTDTNLTTQGTQRSWEKKYQGKFAEQKRDRRRV